MTDTKETAVEGREYQGVSIPPAGTYELDPVHTVVGFVARHMLSKVRVSSRSSPERSRSATRRRIRASRSRSGPRASRRTPRRETNT